MKRLLLLPLVFAPAAHAVDYIRCEAMQKALSRSRFLEGEVVSELRSRFRIQEAAKICGPKPAASRSGTWGSLINEDRAWSKCKDDLIWQPMTQSRIEAMVASSPQYLRATQRTREIRSDFERNGCF